MTISIIKSKTGPRAARKIFSAVLWLALWQLLCTAVKQEILVVSPARVFLRLCILVQDAAFWLTVSGTLERVALGFAAGAAIGALLSALTAVSGLLYDIFHPIVEIIKATPVASFIILLLVWTGAENVPAITSALIVIPVVWENVSEGIRKTDAGLLEMARVFRFGRVKAILKIYVPCTMPYFTAACASGLGFAWKAGVAAEVLANLPLSIGGQIYDAKIYLDTVNLFAWTAVVVIASVALETALSKAASHIRKKRGGESYGNQYK